MFGIPTIAKIHPNASSPRSTNNNNNNNTSSSNNNNRAAFAHVNDSSPARRLPPTNHTRTNLAHFHDETNQQNGNNNNNATITENHPQNFYNHNNFETKIVTGRKRAPPDNLSCPQNQRKGDKIHSVPWAESAPGAPVTSTTKEMYQSAEDRDRNFRKHLRKQFREYNLEHLIPTTLSCKEEEIDLERERQEDEENKKNNNKRGGIPGSSLRFTGSINSSGRRAGEWNRNTGATDLKLTTIPNTKKKTFHSNRIAPGTSKGEEGDPSKFCSTVDEIGLNPQYTRTEGEKKAAEQNVSHTSRLHNGARKVHIAPYLVYEDEVARLPSIPTVGITYTGARPENNSEVIFPWDRPRVGADGAAKLARRENRRLVTQRRLEFAEQFLPEICAGMTTSISKRVAEQYEANRGVAQPLPLSLEPLDNASLRGPTQITKGGAVVVQQRNNSNSQNNNSSNTSGYYRGGAEGIISPRHQNKNNNVSAGRRNNKNEVRRSSSEERTIQKQIEREERKQRAESIKSRVKDLVEGHTRSLKTHDLIMQVAVTSLS